MNWRRQRPSVRMPLVVSALLTAMTLGATIAHAEPAAALPRVPANLQVPDGNVVFRVGHAVGTQNYICLPADGGPKFVLYTPQATLFGDANDQLATHYFSPNPAEAGTVRATWQDSRDSSAVWGQAMQSSTDRDFVAPGAIPWVLLQGVGTQPGPGGDGSLAGTTFVQRLNTSGGVAPEDGCQSAADIGTQAFVPYTADYVFYTASSS